MKILADTNILIFALLWPNSKPAAALLHAVRHHELVLCDRNIFELRDVLRRKAPQALADVDVFLAELAYDLVPAPEYPQKLISDPKESYDCISAFEGPMHTYAFESCPDRYFVPSLKNPA